MSDKTDYDVIVIGGGIVGAGILRDCALRGLKASLLEKGEPGLGTTDASTHLIHGGLRYLLYDRLTTQTTSWDSGNIVRIARPLLTRLPIVWPVYKDHRHALWTVETLLESYDAFSRFKEGLPHLRLPAAEVLRLFPGLKTEGLLGAVIFDEWWVETRDLVGAHLESARRAGAEVQTRTAAVGLPMEDGRVRGVEITLPEGRRRTLTASVVINASGPWVDALASLAGIRIPLRLRKGTHLLYRRQLLSQNKTETSDRKFPPPVGLLLEAEGGGRYVFAIGVNGKTLIGPTDLPFDGLPDELRTDPSEIRHLLSSIRRYFKDFPERYDATTVGARPILRQNGPEKLLSREFEILDHGARDGIGGLITAAGGKMSDFRLMAEEAVDAACRALGRDLRCSTHLKTLQGDTLESGSPFPMPSRPLARFFRKHPHVREWHALSHLGIQFARHMARCAARKTPSSSEEDFRRRYSA